MIDGVFKPAHYTQYKVEPITFIMENELPFAEGNIIKYVMRWRAKDGLKDLQKARRYIDMLIETETDRDIEAHRQYDFSFMVPIMRL